MYPPATMVPGASTVLRLQRTVGNGVVAGLVAERGAGAAAHRLQRMDRDPLPRGRQVGAEARAAINNKLRKFKSSTSAGFFKQRSDAWSNADTHIAAVYGAGDLDDARYYALLIMRLMAAEVAVAGATTQEDGVRRIGYGAWKRELLELLDAGEIERRMRALIDHPGEGARLEGHGPRVVSPDRELEPMGRLPSNEYAGINAALRSEDPDPAARKAALLDSALVLQQYRRFSYAFENDLRYAGSGGQRVERVARTLFDGSTPDEGLEEGRVLVDKGWSFFGGASENVSGGKDMPYVLHTVLTKAVDYSNELYGSHERFLEYATPPGSRFQFERREGKRWYFTQV